MSPCGVFVNANDRQERADDYVEENLELMVEVRRVSQRVGMDPTKILLQEKEWLSVPE